METEEIIEHYNEGNYSLIPIDIDLITSLRFQGQSYLAHELLQIFREDVKRTGKQALKEAESQDRIIRKHLGICINIGCPRATSGASICDVCSTRSKKTLAKLNKYRKDNNLCLVCGDEQSEQSKRMCQKHLDKYSVRKDWNDLKYCAIWTPEEIALVIKVFTTTKKSSHERVRQRKLLAPIIKKGSENIVNKAKELGLR